MEADFKVVYCPICGMCPLAQPATLTDVDCSGVVLLTHFVDGMLLYVTPVGQVDPYGYVHLASSSSSPACTYYSVYDAVPSRFRADFPFGIMIHTNCFDYLLHRCLHWENGERIDLVSKESNGLFVNNVVARLYEAFILSVDDFGRHNNTHYGVANLPPDHPGLAYRWCPPLHLPCMPRLCDKPDYSIRTSRFTGALAPLPNELILMIFTFCSPSAAFSLRNTCVHLAKLSSYGNKHWYNVATDMLRTTPVSPLWTDEVDWLAYGARIDGRLDHIKKGQHISLVVDQIAADPLFGEIII